MSKTICKLNNLFQIYLDDVSHLEEEAEADPLIVLVVSPLQRVLGLVHAGVRHVETNPLPEGTGDGVGGVDPTEGV